MPNSPNITEETAFPTTPPYPSSAIITKTIAPKRTRRRISRLTSCALISSSASLSESAFVILFGAPLPAFLPEPFCLFLLFVLFFALDEAIRSCKPSLFAAVVRRHRSGNRPGQISKSSPSLISRSKSSSSESVRSNSMRI